MPIADIQSVDHWPVERHERYYLATGDTVFQVENHLFRIHRYFFVRESVVFQDMLSMPIPTGATKPEGSSDDNPIFLPTVKNVDFARFVWVFYNPKHSIYNATSDEWISILSLAHMWQFNEVKELAIRELEKLPILPVTKAVLAVKYDVQHGWAEEAYATIGARNDPLNSEEEELLGYTTALKLWRVRERIRNRRYTRYRHSPEVACEVLHYERPPPPPFGPADMQDVEAVFGSL